VSNFAPLCHSNYRNRARSQIRTQRRHSEAVFLSLEPAAREITTEYVKWKDEIILKALGSHHSEHLGTPTGANFSSKPPTLERTSSQSNQIKSNHLPAGIHSIYKHATRPAFAPNIQWNVQHRGMRLGVHDEEFVWC
jgi:hypothetical protein